MFDSTFVKDQLVQNLCFNAKVPDMLGLVMFTLIPHNA
jgi:hypothetical protein